MAKFELFDAQIRKIEKGQNAGKFYLAARLVNVLAPLDKRQKFTEFDESIVDQYRQFIPVSKGGTGAEDVKLPDILRYVSGHYVTWIPPKECIPFQRIYVTDVTDANGKMHPAGSIIKDKNGNPRLYESVVVFCRYYIDPDFPGQPQYYSGNNPSQKGEQYFGQFCVAYNQVASETIVSDEDEGIYQAPSQPVQQPVQQTATPPGMKLQGYDVNGQPIYVPV